MLEWKKEYTNLQEGIITQKQYEEWKYNFPKYSTLNFDQQPRKTWLTKNKKNEE